VRKKKRKNILFIFNLFLGELVYQQDLERRDPKKFKALLERNGIEYNPNYIRGNWNDE
jgi:hypothetical protein